MIVSYIIDHISLWGWLVIIGVPTGILLYFFGPILMPIWRMLPLPVRVGLIGIGAAILAFLGGRYRGRANAEEEQRRRDAQSLQKRTEVDHDVDVLSDKQTSDKLRERWSRDQP
jgi:membrane protein implicated in regulation of membrane protease activity